MAGCEVDKLVLDSGVEKTVVQIDLAPPVMYTGKSVVLDSFRGNDKTTHPLAVVRIQVGGI